MKKRKIKEIAKVDEDTVEIIEETYAEIEEELIHRIKGLQNQMNLSVDKRNDIIRINRLAKTAIDIFNDILNKKNLDKKDLELIIDKIIVFEDRIHVKLKADIDNLLKVGVVTTFYYQQVEGREQLLSVAEETNGNRTGAIADIGTDNSAHMEMIASEVKAGKEPIVNFNQDSKVISNKKESPDTHNNLTKSGINELLTTNVPLKTRNKPERLFTVNVISSGDSLEIYTENAGEIILKKYSPIQELKALAQPYAESLSLTSGCVVAVADRDCIVATSQGGKKDFEHKMLSREMEKTILGRKKIMAQGDSKDYVQVANEDKKYSYEVMCPVIVEGDVAGGVILLSKTTEKENSRVQEKLAAFAADFLGRQME